MKTKITCFIPMEDEAQVRETIAALKSSPLTGPIYLLTAAPQASIDGCETITAASLFGSETIRMIAEKAETDYTLFYTKHSTLALGYFALERMVQILEDAQAGMVYADRYQTEGATRKQAPVIDYQMGSLRDDFDFGSVLLFRSDAFREAAARMTSSYRFAGLYDLRLKLSQKNLPVHINEYLYTEVLSDTRKSGEKIFDYVDPKNRDVQIEMEQACTEHLKEIGGYLESSFGSSIAFDAGHFEYEARPKPSASTPPMSV